MSITTADVLRVPTTAEVKTAIIRDLQTQAIPKRRRRPAWCTCNDHDSPAPCRCGEKASDR